MLIGQSGTADLSILNNGMATLAISGLALEGANVSSFAITAPAGLPGPATPIEVPTGGSAPVSIECAPQTAGGLTASLAVTSDAANGSPTYVTLNCNGLTEVIFDDGFEAVT